MVCKGAHTSELSVHGRSNPSTSVYSPLWHAECHSEHRAGQTPTRRPVPISGWQGAQCTTELSCLHCSVKLAPTLPSSSPDMDAKYGPSDRSTAMLCPLSQQVRCRYSLQKAKSDTELGACFGKSKSLVRGRQISFVLGADAESSAEVELRRAAAAVRVHAAVTAITARSMQRHVQLTPPPLCRWLLRLLRMEQCMMG